MALIPIDQQDSRPSHARIGYENLLVNSDITSALAVLQPNTYQRYFPAAGAVTTRFQLDVNTEIDFIGIAAHNFGTHAGGNVPVLISYSTTIGGALIDIEQVSRRNNTAIMLLFDAVGAAEIAITHNTTAGLEYGVVFAGIALQVTQPIYGGNSPINLSASTEYQSTMSETGQFLGRSITRKGLTGAFSWRNLDPDWYRETFNPFVQSARRLPFFMMWRPDLYSEEVAYCHTTGDIKPSNQGGGTRLMSVSMNTRGHSDLI